MHAQGAPVWEWSIWIQCPVGSAPKPWSRCGSSRRWIHLKSATRKLLRWVGLHQLHDSSNAVIAVSAVGDELVISSEGMAWGAWWVGGSWCITTKNWLQCTERWPQYNYDSLICVSRSWWTWQIAWHRTQKEKYGISAPLERSLNPLFLPYASAVPAVHSEQPVCFPSSSMERNTEGWRTAHRLWHWLARERGWLAPPRLAPGRRRPAPWAQKWPADN